MTDGPRPVERDPLDSAFAGGEEWALRAAYERFSPLVHTIAVRTLNSAADADDVTQQVFVKAWRSASTYDPRRGSLRSWLAGITRYAVTDQLRARRRQTALADRAATASAQRDETTDSQADDVVDAVLVADELAALGQPQQEILRLSFYGDLSRSPTGSTCRWAP